jgi:hypothetical protein
MNFKVWNPTVLRCWVPNLPLLFSVSNHKVRNPAEHRTTMVYPSVLPNYTYLNLVSFLKFSLVLIQENLKISMLYKTTENKQSSIFELLRAIHDFYPIGLSSLGTSWPGYKKLIASIKKKNNALEKNKAFEWQKFISQLNSIENIVRIDDMSFGPFPSYMAYLHLPIFKSGIFEIQSYINIEISILTKHFTAYFCTDYNLANGQKKWATLVQNSLHPFNNNVRLIENISEALTQIPLIFKDYNYASATQLFSVKLETKFSPSYDTELAFHDYYSLYDYLFSTRLNGKGYTMLL